MQIVRNRSLSALSLLLAVAAVGCSQGSSSVPTGPSASMSPGTVTADTEGSPGPLDATFATLDKGKGGDKGKDSDENEKSDSERGKPDTPSRGELSGFVTAVSPTSITVRGITVTAAPGAVIRHGNQTILFSAIVVGDHVQARGTKTPDALVASEIKVERTRRGKEDDDAEDGGIEGVISGLTSTTGCPVLSFKVGTTTVTTTAATVFDGVLCTALANDVLVEVKGTPQSDGSVVATKIEPADEEEDDDDGAKAEGLVGGLPSATTCPTLTFMVGTKQVKTTATTKYEGVTCATIANAMRLEVKGVLTPGGWIEAAKVELDN